jgi:hypothetical protein
MTHQLYQIHTSATTAFDADMDVTQPVRLLIAELVVQAGLPACDRQGFPIAYALFAGDERRRLSSEQTLEQAHYASGGDLYLAPADAPWWMQTFIGRRPATSVQEPAAVGETVQAHPMTSAKKRMPVSPAALTIVGAGVLALILLFIFFSEDNPVLNTPSFKSEYQGSNGNSQPIFAPVEHNTQGEPGIPSFFRNHDADNSITGSTATLAPTATPTPTPLPTSTPVPQPTSIPQLVQPAQPVQPMPVQPTQPVRPAQPVQPVSPVQPNSSSSSGSSSSGGSSIGEP